MKVRLGLFLIGAVTLATACSQADTTSSGDPTPTAAPVSSTVEPSAPTSRPVTTPVANRPLDAVTSSHLLVVQRIDPDDVTDVSYVVVAQDGSELATLSPPEDLRSRFAIVEIHQAPGARHALVEAQNALATLDTETLDLETYLTGIDVEWRDPEARFLIVSAAQKLQVVDLADLTRRDIGSFERFVSAGRAGDRLIVSAVENGEMRNVIVDVTADSVVRLDTAVMSGWSYDDSGEQLLARASPLGNDRLVTEFLVSPASEPTSQRSWYASDRGPRAVWGDDSLVVAEASGGRVLIVSAESVVDLGVLSGDRPGNMIGDPTSAGVLVEHGDHALSSWYHVDPVAAALTELPGIRGLSVSSTVTSRPGLVVLDDAVSGSGFSAGRVVAVRVRDGKVTELVSTPDRSIVSGGALGDHLVVVGLGADQPLQFFDLESGETITIDEAVSARLDPDALLASVEFGVGRSRTTSLLELSTGTLRELTNGHVIAWLQR